MNPENTKISNQVKHHFKMNIETIEKITLINGWLEIHHGDVDALKFSFSRDLSEALQLYELFKSQNPKRYLLNGTYMAEYKRETP